MKNKNYLIDNNEFSIINRFNGVELICPNNLSSIDMHQACSVSSLLTLPCNVYFYDTEHSFILSNENNAQSCGFESPYQVIGNSVFKATTKNYANKLAMNNQKTLSIKRKIFFEEEIMLSNGSFLQGMTIKMPLFIDSKINGIFGCTIVFGRDDLFNSLNTLMKLGLLTSKQREIFSNSEMNIHLTNREKQCLRLTILGKTSREISTILGLTKRTVEFYIANIKSKFNVSKKSDLIEKSRNYFN